MVRSGEEQERNQPVFEEERKIDTGRFDNRERRGSGRSQQIKEYLGV
jgi:hypothetical protein